MNWLAEHLKELSLEEEHEGYLLGRGGKEESICRLGVRTWKPLQEPAPSKDFREKYGDFGGKLEGWLIWPLRSPVGRVLGFAGRQDPEETPNRFLLPEADWNPIWTGLTPEVMTRIWAGVDIWVVEGLFDLLPLEWAVPEQDAVLGSERARLTDKHVEFLRRYCGGRVILVYGNDDVGRHGIHGWVDDAGKKRWGDLQRLQSLNISAESRQYRGKTPGEVWRQGGVLAMQKSFPR